MSIHMTSMTAAQLTERARRLAAESADLAKLAAQMTRFERTYGCKLFLSEAQPGTEYVGQVKEPKERPVEIAFGQRKPDLELTDKLTEMLRRKIGEPDVEEQPGEPEPQPVKAAPSRPDQRLTDSAPLAKVETPAKQAPAPEPIKKESPAKAEPAAAKQAPDQKPVKKPAPAKTAAPKPEAVKEALKPQEGRPWGALSLAEREIVKHLERLPETFTVAEDLQLVELLTSGQKLPFIADVMEVAADALLARWKSFWAPQVLGPNGLPSIDGQKQLLNALRYRKEAAA